MEYAEPYTGLPTMVLACGRLGAALEPPANQMWSPSSTSDTTEGALEWEASTSDESCCPSSQGWSSDQVDAVLDDFMLSMARGEVSTVDRLPNSAQRSTQPLTLDELFTRVVVRRREMDCSSDFFHSIRTRTASIVSVCFAGSADMVLQMASRIPRMSFSESHFQRCAEHAVGANSYVFLCTTMRDVTELASFGFAHGASAHPEPSFYRVEAIDGLYAVVFEFVLTAIDTTIRNLNGQREVVIDLNVLLPHDTHLQAAWSDFAVKVDIQPGESGRNRREARAGTEKASVVRASSRAVRPSVVEQVPIKLEQHHAVADVAKEMPALWSYAPPAPYVNYGYAPQQPHYAAAPAEPSYPQHYYDGSAAYYYAPAPTYAPPALAHPHYAPYYYPYPYQQNGDC